MEKEREVMDEKYPLSLQKIRQGNHELGEKYRKLFHELQAEWVGFTDVFRELNLGIHDEALSKTVVRSVVEPLRELFSVMAKLHGRNQELLRQVSWFESQKATREKVSQGSENVAMDLMAAFDSLLKDILSGRESQKTAIGMLEKDVRECGHDVLDRGQKIHSKLMGGIKPITEKLAIYETSVQERKKFSVSEAENIIDEVEVVYRPWEKLLNEYDAILDELGKVYENSSLVQEMVSDLSGQEDNLLKKLRIWEGLFDEAKFNPYDYLGIKPEDRLQYTAEKSRIPECKALLNIALPDLPQVKSLSRLSERVQSLLESLEEIRRERKPVFAPKPGPKLVTTEKKSDKAIVLGLKISPMQLAVAVYGVICESKRSRGRTPKVVYEHILMPSGFIFNLEYGDFFKGVKKAQDQGLMDVHTQWGKWLWKPTPKGFEAGKALMGILPKDFEEKVRESLIKLNEFQRELKQEYKKKPGENPAS